MIYESSKDYGTGEILMIHDGETTVQEVRDYLQRNHSQEMSEGIVEHPLVRLLMNYDNCPDDAVNAAAALVEKLVEVHNAAGHDWETWMKTRSVDWFDEVADLLRPFEANSQR